MQQKLTYQAASDYADQLHKASTDVRTIVDTIRSEFVHVGSVDYWAGDVANNSRKEFDNLAAKLEDFITVITEEANHLDTVVEEYHSADESVRGKSDSQIADEVIQGKWGNGPDRNEKLKEAGYDPNQIQGIVNQKINGTYVEPKPSTPAPSEAIPTESAPSSPTNNGPIKTGIPGEDTYYNTETVNVENKTAAGSQLEGNIFMQTLNKFDMGYKYDTSNVIASAAAERGFTKEQIDIAVGISRWETGNYSDYKAADYFNYGGTRGTGSAGSSPAGFKLFATQEEGINDFLSNLQNNYFNQGLNTVEQIQPKYAPASDGNDAAKWISQVNNMKA